MRNRNRKRYAKQNYDMAQIIHHATKQVFMKRDLKKWGKQSEYELSKDTKKFHMREAFLPLDPSQMTEEENSTAL